MCFNKKGGKNVYEEKMDCLVAGSSYGNSFAVRLCRTREGRGDVIEVWSFTNELEQMLDLYKATHPDVKVKFTLVPTDVYASKLKNAIQSGNAPDVFAIEEAFVRSFVEEPGVMADLEDLKPDLEEMEILDYTLDVGTDFDGNLRAVSWQAAPGAMFYRRSLAKEYLGTDDPQKVQEYFQDMDKFMETAEIIKEKSQEIAILSAARMICPIFS